MARAGPHHEGENASMCLVSAATLDVRETLPLVRPFLWLSETTLLAHTPRPNIHSDKKSYAVTRLPGYRANAALLAKVALPETPGLISLDLVTRQVRLLCEASLLDELTHAVLSSDQRVIYAATRCRRIVALRREDGTTLWELPSLRDSFRFSLLVFALSPDGSQLAIVIVRRDGSVSAFKASASEVSALAFSVSGRELISGSHEDCLRVWPFEV